MNIILTQVAAYLFIYFHTLSHPPPFSLIHFAFFAQMTLSLGLTIQPNTLLAHSFRQSADGTNQLSFDLRFVEGVDEKDAEMAISGINASSTQQFEAVQVVFRSKRCVWTWFLSERK